MSSPTNDGDKPLPAIEPVCDGLTPAPKRALVYTLTSSDKQYRKHTHTTMAPMSAIELKVACVSIVIKTEAGKREGRMEGGRKEGRERGRKRRGEGRRERGRGRSMFAHRCWVAKAMLLFTGGIFFRPRLEQSST